MPRVLAQADVALTVEPPLSSECAKVDRAEVRLLVGALGDAVLLLSCELHGSLNPLMETLRRLRDADAGHVVTFRDPNDRCARAPLEAVYHMADAELRRALEGWETSDIGSGHIVELDPNDVPVFSTGPPESAHNAIVCSPDNVDTALVNRILFYDAEPYRSARLRPAFAGTVYPVITNRYEGTLAAVGPNGALLVGYSERFTRAMVLSHVLIRGIRLRAERVRGAAFQDLRLLYDVEREVASVLAPDDHQRDEPALRLMRTRLSELSERCGRHRVELAFGAEAMLDVEVIIPSSIVGNYHRSVVTVSRVSDMVATATMLVERLESAVTAMRIVVETAEREADERRNAHLAKVGGMLAAVGLALTFVFGFYGSNVVPIGTRPLFAASDGYLAFTALGVLLFYAVVAVVLRDPWLRLGRLGRERLRRPGT
jgi:hypothetical protein